MLNLNRLTNENDDLAFMCNYLKEKTVFDSDRIKAIHEKLKAYEVLEEQGLLIKLPCKVGDTIYHKNDNTKIPYTRHCINKIVIDDDVKFFYTDVHFFRIAEIGKTVFLTREEAEKTLK